MRTRHVLSCCFVAVMLVASLARPSHAQTDAAAEELRRGDALVQQGNCREALPHLAESQSLAPSPKALLDMAGCELELGDLAAARAHATQGRDLAQERKDAELSTAAGTLLASIDAKGTHPEIAVAPGAKQEVPEPPVTPPAASRSHASGKRLGALTLGGVGIAAVVVGSVFGLHAIAKNHDSNADGHCDATGCDPTGTALRNEALSAATVSTVSFAVGLTAIAGGAALYVLGPHPVRIAPAAGPSYGGIDLRAVW
jgi:hypothetical protein